MRNEKRFVVYDVDHGNYMRVESFRDKQQAINVARDASRTHSDREFEVDDTLLGELVWSSFN